MLQISFSGKVQSKGQTIIAIDDVSFSPERCEKIPFTTNQSKKLVILLPVLTFKDLFTRTTHTNGRRWIDTYYCIPYLCMTYHMILLRFTEIKEHVSQIMLRREITAAGLAIDKLFSWLGFLLRSISSRFVCPYFFSQDDNMDSLYAWTSSPVHARNNHHTKKYFPLCVGVVLLVLISCFVIF